MESILMITVLSFTFHNVKLAKVVLDVDPYAQRGKDITFNCSSDFIPIGQTAELLVNNVTLTYIRKHKGICFNTKLKKTCADGSCSCADNGKLYRSVYKPHLKDNKVSFRCRMKFMGGTVKLSDEVFVMIINIHSPTIQLKENLPLISGTSVNLICYVPKTNASFFIVWKCDHVTYQKDTMVNETFVWSTLSLKIDSTYDGTQCICSLHSKTIDFVVSGFITLYVKNTPILNLNKEPYCNSTSTVALVCSVQGELGMFGFAQWIHSVDGKYIRSLPGTTERYISLLFIKDCSFQDGGDYTCSAWNKDGDSILWANQTTTLVFAGPPIILRRTVKVTDAGREIMVTFYTSSEPSVVFVKWQCDGIVINNSVIQRNFQQIPTDFEIYNKKILLSAYKTSISVHSNHCLNGNYDVCLYNEYDVHCENILLTKDGNGLNVLWIMLVMVLCIVAVGITPTLVVVMKSRIQAASQSIQIEEFDNSTNDERYLQINEPDHIATHQYNAASRPYIDPVPRHSTRGDEIDLGPYIDPLPYRSVRGYETTGRPYSDLVPYQSSRGYDVTSPEYLDVQPDTDTNSSQSDQYEKVD